MIRAWQPFTLLSVGNRSGLQPDVLAWRSTLTSCGEAALIALRRSDITPPAAARALQQPNRSTRSIGAAGKSVSGTEIDRGYTEEILRRILHGAAAMNARLPADGRTRRHGSLAVAQTGWCIDDLLAIKQNRRTAGTVIATKLNHTDANHHRGKPTAHTWQLKREAFYKERCTKASMLNSGGGAIYQLSTIEAGWKACGRGILSAGGGHITG